MADRCEKAKPIIAICKIKKKIYFFCFQSLSHLLKRYSERYCECYNHFRIFAATLCQMMFCISKP